MAEAQLPSVQLICDAKASIGESPVWCESTAYWTDPVSRRLLTHTRAGAFRAHLMSSSVWSLALLPDGALAGALDDRFCIITRSGEISAGPPAAIAPGCRFNDMAVDLHGGLWVGAMHRGILAARGAIFYASALHETPICVAAGLGVPNGMKLSADGRTLFAVDTLERTLLAYPLAGDSLGEPVIVSDFLDLPGKPDGMTLGPDGTFWVAMWGGSCIVQMAADGAPLRRIALPAPHVSSLCFAGTDRLLVTTSRMRLSPQTLREHPASGGLFEISPRPA